MTTGKEKKKQGNQKSKTAKKINQEKKRSQAANVKRPMRVERPRRKGNSKKPNTDQPRSRSKWKKYLNNEELYKEAYETGDSSKSKKLKQIKAGKKISKRSLTVRKRKKNSLIKSAAGRVDKNSKRLTDYHEPDDVRMSFVEHLEELRKRFINILIIFGIFASIALFLSEYLVSLLQNPYILTGEKLITTRPTGAFLTRLKVSLMASLVLSIPLILHQVWLFIFPALSDKFRKMGFWILAFAFILFSGGVAFNFFIVLPMVLNALQNIVWEGVEILYNIDDYYDFVMLTSIMFGAIFEMPILVLIFVRIGILSHIFLIKQWRYSLVLGAIIAAIITPPDAFSLLMMLIPMVLLYLLSIGIAFLFRRKD